MWGRPSLEYGLWLPIREISKSQKYGIHTAIFYKTIIGQAAVRNLKLSNSVSGIKEAAELVLI